MQTDTTVFEEAFSDTAVFPNKATGRFNRAQLRSGSTYEVHGKTIEKNSLSAPATSTPKPVLHLLHVGIHLLRLH